jgi:hypothetical protein
MLMFASKMAMGFARPPGTGTGIGTADGGVTTDGGATPDGGVPTPSGSELPPQPATTSDASANAATPARAEAILLCGVAEDPDLMVHPLV